MKLLAVTALLVAGSLAVPAGSYPPPSPTYGDDPSGEVGYPPKYPPEYAPQHPEYPPGHGGYGGGPDDGDKSSYAPPSTTQAPSYPTTTYGEGESYPTTTYGGEEETTYPVASPTSSRTSSRTSSPTSSPTAPAGDNDGDDGDDGDDVPGTPEQPPTDGDSNPPDDGDDGDDTVGGGDDGDGEDDSSDLCAPLLYSNPQCCDASVLGVLDLNCTPPPSTPTDYDSFNDICQGVGKKAQCCVIPILGQALLCEDVPLQ